MPVNIISNNPPELYSPWVGLVYIFNIIVGTGALTLPAVFAGAGWLLSLILVVALAFFGFVTVTFIIESIACANATVQWKRIQSHRIDGESEAFDDSDSSKDREDISEETAMINSSTRRRYYTLNQRIELGVMATLYFNKVGRLLFFIALCLYLYGDLSIYAAAIAKTLSDLACNSTNKNSSIQDNFSGKCWETSDIDKMSVYRIFVFLFAILVGPFSYFNVQKTKYLQLFTSSMRWCAFTIMIAIAITELTKYGPRGSPKVVHLQGIPALIGASVYSFMSHHSLPGLVTPFANKQHIIRQLALDYILICAFYILLAITGSFAFANLSDLYTLNFAPNSLNISGMFMKTIEYFLGLFPVFTLSTSFPIIAITLQNNLKALFLDIDKIEHYNFILRRLAFPTIAIVPPIIVALLTHNVGSLVEITGSFAGAAIQYVIPAFLVWAARRECKLNIGSVTSNKYASPFKGTLWVVIVLLWSLACIILVFLHLLSSYM